MNTAGVALATPLTKSIKEAFSAVAPLHFVSEHRQRSSSSRSSARVISLSVGAQELPRKIASLCSGLFENAIGRPLCVAVRASRYAL